jgi:hypothetical protein
MAAIANRELSQFGSFLDVDGAITGVPSNIGIAANTTVNVGIGTSVAASKLAIQGDVAVSGVLTATSSLNSPIIIAPTAYINAGIITNITGTYLNYTGIATIASLNVTSSASLGGLGVSTATFNTLYSVVGVVTNIAGTGLTYTSGTFTNLVSNNGYLNVGVVTSLAGTGLTYTNGTFSNLYATNGYINTGIVTSLTGTGVTYTNGTFSNLYATNGYINTGIVTTLSGTNLSYSGISTIGGVQFSTAGIVTAGGGVGAVVYYGDGSKLVNVSAQVYAQRDSVLPLLNNVGVLSTFNFVNTNGGTTYSAGFLSVDVGKAASGPANAVQFKNSSGIFSGSSSLAWDGVSVVVSGNANFTGIVTAANFNSTSDLNLKENISTFDNALDVVSQLRGVRFDWKSDNKPSIGVIAQELEEVLPELVTDTNPKTVNYNGIIGVLIEAIKELNAEVENLKSQINNQQGAL